MNGAGSAAEAFAGETHTDAASLWRELEQLLATARLPIYINGIGELGSPYWRAAQPSYFIGEITLLKRFAAVIESIVLLITINFDCMRRFEPQQSSAAERTGLAARRERLEARLREPA